MEIAKKSSFGGEPNGHVCVCLSAMRNGEKSKSQDPINVRVDETLSQVVNASGGSAMD